MCRIGFGYKNRDVKTAEVVARGRARRTGRAVRHEWRGLLALWIVQLKGWKVFIVL